VYRGLPTPSAAGTLTTSSWSLRRCPCLFVCLCVCVFVQGEEVEVEQTRERGREKKSKNGKKKKRRALSQSFPSLLLPTSLLPPISLAIAQHRSKRASCSPPNDWRRRKRPREVQSCGRRRDPPRRSDEKTDDFKVVILNRSLTLLSRRLPMGVGAPLFPSVGVPPFWLPWPRRPPGTGMGDEEAAMVFRSFFPLFFRAGNRP
jgi:hypothetical protein